MANSRSFSAAPAASAASGAPVAPRPTTSSARGRLRAVAPDEVAQVSGLADISGIDAARMIKENPSSVRIPLIACTGWEKEKWLKRATDVGIAAYLVKPVPADLLKKTIEKFILP